MKALLTILSILLFSCFTRAQTVVDIIANSPDHNGLEAAVIAAGLADDLSGDGPFTVFAPTDAAFSAVPPEVLAQLFADQTGALADLLLYHVLGAEVLSTDLADGQVATTLLGEDITVSITQDGIFINDAQVTVADLQADNGVVHVIDAVLIPPVQLDSTVWDIIVASPEHNTLEAAIIAAGLVEEADGPGLFTVFAPTDAAFAALPAGLLDTLLADPTGELANILLYHLALGEYRSDSLADGETLLMASGDNITVTINAEGVFINDAKVIVADILADNGVVHVIDAVLLPPVTTVVDIIVNSPDHNILEAAVIAAQLADDLSGDGPFTVFAPTDAAFAALPAGLVDELLADPTGDLAQILLYHVLGAQVLSTGLTDGQVATTLQGEDVTVTINAEGVFINDAKVVVADILADNGVVHVIDAVLLPPVTTVVDIIVNSPDHTILEAAVIAAQLADDLSGDGPFTVFAPTDAAFAALPAGLVDELLTDPTGDLAQILLYHVLGAQVLSTGLTDGQVATTLQGDDVTVTINAEGVFINDAKVVVADILADNGVVHVIDAVLLPPVTTVVDIIANSPDHNILEAAVIAAQLADDLSGDGPFTVFAPTDAAFAALPAGLVDELLADPTGNLAQILLYHVLGAQVLSTGLTDGQVATTLQGDDVTVTINAEGVFINDAKVVVADILADNGVVHVIDAVLLPPVTTVVDIIVNSPDHNILETAVIAAQLADDLSGDGPFTVFAPTDAAFAALPAGLVDELLADPTGELAQILLYHVLGAQVLSTGLADGQVATTLQGDDVTVTINAEGVFINDAKVVVADILADNGVVHVIDAVLLPPVTTVVDIIVNSPDHTILEAAVIAAGLADDLSGDGPFTVFAPTDAAFAALPAGLVDELLADPTGDLAQILLYHVLGAQVLSTGLADGQVATTLQGEDVTVTINAEGVFINDAKVVVADILADNGVVHVIDAVLLPAIVNTAEPSLEERIRVFPNPASGKFQVALPEELAGKAVLTLYNLEGGLLRRWHSQEQVERVDVSGMPAGAYILQIQSEAFSAYQRLLLSR